VLFFPLSYVLSDINPEAHLFRGIWGTLGLSQFWIAFLISTCVLVLPLLGYMRLQELHRPSVREFAIHASNEVLEEDIKAPENEMRVKLLNTTSSESIMEEPKPAKKV